MKSTTAVRPTRKTSTPAKAHDEDVQIPATEQPLEMIFDGKSADCQMARGWLSGTGTVWFGTEVGPNGQPAGLISKRSIKVALEFARLGHGKLIVTPHLASILEVYLDVAATGLRSMQERYVELKEQKRAKLEDLNVRLPIAMANKVKALAASSGDSETKVILMALRDYLTPQPAK